MHKKFDDTDPAHQRKSFAAFVLILLFTGAADGLMDVIGPGLFLAVGAGVMGAAWALLDYYMGGN